MSIPLKEEPREWRRFTVQVCGVFGLLGSLLVWRGALSAAVLPGLFSALVVTAVAAVARPRWFRRFYRAGMIVSGRMNEWMSPVVLTLFFFVAMVPLGCVLRWAGADLLALKKRPNAATYWRTARPPRKWEQMF